MLRDRRIHVILLCLILATPLAMAANGPPPHANDPFVDEDGDTMTGDLVFDGANIDLADNALILNGGELASPDGSDLTFAGQDLCFEQEDLLECEGFDWHFTGNAGTNPTEHFLGTTDGAALRLQAAAVGVNTAAPGAVLHVAGDGLYDSGLGVGGALDVAGATTLGGTLGVAGATALADTLGVAGDTALGGALGVAGATDLQSTLAVADATTLGGTLGVAGATDLASTLGVAGATTLGSTLDVASDVTSGGSGDFAGTLAAADILVRGTTLAINSDGPDGNSRLCFFEGDLCGEFLLWDDATDDGNGNFTISDDLVVQGSVAETSSALFKENVAPIDNALAKAVALEGVTYNWRDSGERDIGVIAQQVAPIVPEAVVYDDMGFPVAVKYGHLVAVLLEAIEEQQTQVDDLDSRLSALEDLLGSE